MEKALCPECREPMETMCEECCIFHDKPELSVTDLYNYQAKPQRFYNRQDHFKELLGQFQGCEGKAIPREIKEKITNAVPLQATTEDVKTAMRKLKLTKYIENFDCVLFTITGIEPPRIPKLMQNKLIRLFYEIDRVYQIVSKEQRNSFLNYCYVLFKLLDLMDQTELLPKVPLLKTRLRLKQRDSVWKKTCEELSWTLKLTDLRQPTSKICRAAIPPICRNP